MTPRAPDEDDDTPGTESISVELTLTDADRQRIDEGHEESASDEDD